MELWIRSQDRERICKVNKLYIKGVGIYSNCDNYNDDYDYDYLGIYETKERALEVLDEIQKKINLINLGHDFGSPMIDLENPTYIYEMPKE